MIKICQIKFEKLFCWQRRWLEEEDFKNRICLWPLIEKKKYVHCLEKVEDLKRVFYYLVCWSRTWPHLQFHQLTAWKLPRRKSCISHSEVQSFKVLDHVGEGVQGREGHVGVLRVQVRLVQRQSQLLRHNLPPSEWNEQMNSLGQHSNLHALDHHIQI